VEREGVRRPSAAALAALLSLASATVRAQEETAPAPDPTPMAAPATPDFPEETLPTKVAEVPGTWDLSLDGTNRRCVMTLLRDRGPAGQKVNFPAGCRRALPIMAPVAGWLYAEDAVRLVDANVRPILLFKRRPDRRSYGATEKGETYSLVPLDIAGLRPAGAEPPPGQAAAEAASPVSPLTPQPLAPTFAPATPPSPVQAVTKAAVSPDAPQPGIYLLDRFREQGTCRLAFEGSGGVKLLPGCRDDGIEVFNPVKWSFANGRMTVTAKRGHAITLVPTADGRWRRDPEVGTTFVLRREP
jgi:hypothetical protein